MARWTEKRIHSNLAERIHCLPDELERQILERFQAALSK